MNSNLRKDAELGARVQEYEDGNILDGDFNWWSSMVKGFKPAGGICSILRFYYSGIEPIKNSQVMC